MSNRADPSAPTTLRTTLPSDVFASLVVFLVALPLSVGIAFASGAPIMAGIIAAIVGGVVVGALSGAPLQVSGPAAGLTVLVYGYVQQFGFTVTCAATVAAGVLQIVLGRLKVARITMAISPAVIHGMLAGIGILITLGQLHVVLGGSPQSSAVKNLTELPAQIARLQPSALALGLLTLATLVAWPRIRGALGPLKVLPGPLVAVVMGTTAAVVAGLDVRRVALDGGLVGGIRLPDLPPAASAIAFAIAAVTLCVIASAESLLCAAATDKLHDGQRADLDKELTAQGVGNALSGLIGGLPVTGVIVRSSANIGSGAKTRMAAILHGVWVLLFVTQLGFLVAEIPLAVLAGLLIHVGANLVNVRHIKTLLEHKEGLVYAAAVGGVVFINLLAGIGIGVALAVIRLLVRLGTLKVDVAERDERRLVAVRGALTFVGVPKLMAVLGALPPARTVEVDLAVIFVDHAGHEALDAWRTAYEKGGGTVVMSAQITEGLRFRQDAA